MSLQIGCMDNMFRMNAPCGNIWGIPDTEPVQMDTGGAHWTSFNEKETVKDPANTVIHFYIPDRQFSIVWNQPDRYLNFFRECRAVVAPDFSNYTDMPKAQQIWNHYRRQWCARYWQENGVNVISSLSWANGQIGDWTFAGIPQGTACATSFVCDTLDKWNAMRELQQVIDLLKPSRLYIKANPKDTAELREIFDFTMIPPYRYKRYTAKSARNGD